MDQEKKLKFTNAGRERHAKLLEQIDDEIALALLAAKYVPGEDIIEVTGADVASLAKSMLLHFRDRYESRRRARRMVTRLYVVLGLGVMLVGLLYPYLAELLHEAKPVQLALIVSGFCVAVTGLAMSFTRLTWNRMRRPRPESGPEEEQVRDAIDPSHSGRY